jgi:hypothetical protein
VSKQHKALMRTLGQPGEGQMKNEVEENELTFVPIHQLVSNSILPDCFVVASFEVVLVKSLVSPFREPGAGDKRRQKPCCPGAFLPVIFCSTPENPEKTYHENIQ